jgi:hypothetical protein
VVQGIKKKQEEEEAARKARARRERRVKELREKGMSDRDIEELVSTERFDRPTRMTRTTSSKSMKSKSSRSVRSTAAGESLQSAAASAAESVLGGLTEGVDLEQHEDVRQLSRQATSALSGARSPAKKSRGKSKQKERERKEEEAKERNKADKAVVAPVRPRPIWFGGTGAVQAEWSALEEFLGGGQGLRKNLEALKEKGKYSQYIATVEGVLSAGMRGQADARTTQLMERLWRQMVVTCNAFGIRCLEQRKYVQKGDAPSLSLSRSLI